MSRSEGPAGSGGLKNGQWKTRRIKAKETEVGPHRREKQQGSTLVVCVMILAILTLLGTTAIINTGTETKITHNTRKSEEAFGESPLFGAGLS